MNIVVCVDESKASKLALDSAIKFLDNSDSKLILLHGLNYEINQTNNEMIRESYDDAISRSEELIEQYIAKTQEKLDENIDIEGVVVGDKETDVIESITNYIDGQKIDQIFIGHRALDKKHEKLYGSFAKEMISKSPVPVVVTTSNGQN